MDIGHILVFVLVFDELLSTAI